MGFKPGPQNRGSFALSFRKTVVSRTFYFPIKQSRDLTASASLKTSLQRGATAQARLHERVPSQSRISRHHFVTRRKGTSTAKNNSKYMHRSLTSIERPGGITCTSHKPFEGGPCDGVATVQVEFFELHERRAAQADLGEERTQRNTT